MKTKLTMLLLALITLCETSKSQTFRYADLKVSFVKPEANTQITSPSVIHFEFIVKNQGPDTIFQTDTLFYSSGHSFKIRNTVTKIPIPSIIAPGDSIFVSDTIAVNSGQTKQNFELFFIQVPMTYGQDNGKLKLVNEFSEDRGDNNDAVILNHIGNSSTTNLVQANGKIFPNPMTGNNLNLEGFRNVKSVTLYNTNLQPVQKINKINSQNSLIINHVRPGVYFVHVVDESGLFVDKLIIK